VAADFISPSAGFRLIQLLPINDTSVYNMWWDSYPYNAISVGTIPAASSTVQLLTVFPQTSHRKGNPTYHMVLIWLGPLSAGFCSPSPVPLLGCPLRYATSNFNELCIIRTKTDLKAGSLVLSYVWFSCRKAVSTASGVLSLQKRGWQSIQAMRRVNCC